MTKHLGKKPTILCTHLDNGPAWAVLAGNHDVAYGVFDLANYKQYFSNNSFDQYFIVDKLLFILLGWNNTDGSITRDRLEWMDNVIERYQEKLAVICLHPHLFGLSFLFQQFFLLAFFLFCFDIRNSCTFFVFASFIFFYFF
jgi:hypothetical protein